ncbi:MAG TPA: phage major capsid protein [Pyrinomonadaceae bacterium]|jgi:HK97 family phage major capsid protein|nr:phage major capsid protein [Pyrinomonadaceae bacterium]
MPYDNFISRSDAGALIPEEVSSQIFQDLPKQSVALSLFKQVKMSSKQQKMPVLSVLPTAYFVNGDTGIKQTTEVNWADKHLEAEEVACIVPIPEAVLDDSAFDVWEEIKPRVVEAIGRTIDAAVLFGTNKPASWATSIFDAATTAGNTFDSGSVVGQKVDVDVSSVMEKVEADGFMVNGFSASVTLKSAFRSLRTTDGLPILQPSLQVGSPDALYNERIYYVTNGAWDASKALLIAGDWTQGIIGVRQDITYKLLDQAVITDNTNAIIYNLAQQDMVALRVVMRLGFQVPNPANPLNAGANRYPFAVLAP